MNNTKKWTVQHRVPFHMPYEYRKHALEESRRRVGLELFKVLWEQRLPCVVDVEEKITKVFPESIYAEGEDTLIELEISVTPVEHKHVVMCHQELPSYSVAREDLFSSIKRKIKEFFK